MSVTMIVGLTACIATAIIGATQIYTGVTGAVKTIREAKKKDVETTEEGNQY